MSPVISHKWCHSSGPVTRERSIVTTTGVFSSHTLYDRGLTLLEATLLMRFYLSINAVSWSFRAKNQQLTYWPPFSVIYILMAWRDAHGHRLSPDIVLCPSLDVLVGLNQAAPHAAAARHHDPGNRKLKHFFWASLSLPHLALPHRHSGTSFWASLIVSSPDLESVSAFLICL